MALINRADPSILGRSLRVLSRENTGLDRRKLRQRLRGAVVGADGGRPSPTNAPSAATFDAVSEKRYASARKSIAKRAVMTVIVITLVFAGIVGVLWTGALRRAGRGDEHRQS